MPDCAGTRLADALTLLSAAGLEVGVVTEVYSETIEAGVVIDQNPAAGSSVARGSTVALTVSKGRAPAPVPDVAGMTQLQAATTITAAGFVLGTVAEAYHPTSPVGEVVGQDPAAGENAVPGTAVNITLSKGPEPVPVPDLTGMTEAEAEAALEAAGLSLGTVSEAFDEVVPAGAVIGQNPAEGTTLLPGAAVNITLSKGPAPVPAPNLVGMTQAEAGAALAAAGLALGTVTQEYSPTVAAGRVISQNPAAGTSVLLGTTVNLVVSKGPEPVSVPNVVGMTQTEAEAAITSAGLAVGAVTLVHSPTVPSGRVIMQNRSPGSRVLPGTSVDLIVSKGPAPVVFPDPELEAAVRTKIAKPEGDIFPADLTGVTELSIMDRDISDLSGIEFCLNLQSLLIYNGLVSDLEPLAGLTQLEGLYLNVNQITDISPLAGLTNLQTLSINHNEITNLGPLAGLTALSNLSLQGNNISYISPLAGLTDLTELVLRSNLIANLAPLSGLANLEYLDLQENTISDIGPLAGLTALEQVYLGDNQIAAIGALSGLTSLDSVHLENNLIVQTAALADNTGLGTDDYVDLRGNALGEEALCFDIPELETRGVDVDHDGACPTRTVPNVVGMTQVEAQAAIAAVNLLVGAVSEEFSETVPEGDVIEQTPTAGATVWWGSGVDLVLSLGREMADFPDTALDAAIRDAIHKPEGQIYAADLAGLTAFGAMDSGISDLSGLEHCHSLISIIFDDNQISDLTPLAEIATLQYVWLSGNEIVDLTPLAELANLQYLDLAGNHIVDISPLAGLTSLRNLDLSQNQVVDISFLAYLTDLQRLYLDVNQITDITALTGLTDLVELWLSDNSISGLTPLIGLTNLQVLELANNSITNIGALTLNAGLGTGDSINLLNNTLDQSSLCLAIPTLTGRGVTVLYSGTCSTK